MKQRIRDVIQRPNIIELARKLERSNDPVREARRLAHVAKAVARALAGVKGPEVSAARQLLIGKE